MSRIRHGPVVSRLVCGLLCTALFAVASARAQEQILVEEGSAMAYLANSFDPGVGTTWTAAVFDTSAWLSGVYGVGYENNPPGATGLISTTVPSSSKSVYTRADFNITDVSSVNSLFMGADHDDCIIAWINGVEVFRSVSAYGFTPTWDGLCGDHESSNGATPDYEPVHNISDPGLGALQNGLNVLAVGVWNSSVASSDIVLVPQLLMNRELTRTPYLQQGTDSSVIVRWWTGPVFGSRVLCGTDLGSLTLCAEDALLKTEHELEVTGLDPNTRYYYAVGYESGGGTVVLAGDDADHFFDTAPPTGTAKPTRIWVLGDSGAGTVPADRVRDAYYTYTGGTHTELFLMLGDNAYPLGTHAEYQRKLFEFYPEVLRKSVLWPTIGNHDAYDATAMTWPYYDNFTIPTAGEAGGLASGTEEYYSFDYANIHFVVLNSQVELLRAPGSSMLLWLTSDLASTTQDWVVAFWHHPPYSKGSHDSDNPGGPTGEDLPLQEMRENVVPILEDYGVDLVLAGHSHSYERSYLIDGHYGLSTTFVESMKVDPGSGNINGDGAYIKPYRGVVPYTGTGDGAVYAVAGASSKRTPGVGVSLGGTEPDHPAMYIPLLTLGSMVLDFNGNRLDGRYVNANGVVDDYFTIFKGQPTQPPVAGLTGFPQTVLVSQTVNFLDQTVNGPTVWAWDFENDGQSDSNARYPTHEYGAIGEYSVKLSVSNSAGADEVVMTDFICVTAGSPGVITGLVFEDKFEAAWNIDPGSTGYDIIKGALELLRSGGFPGSQLECLSSGMEARLNDPSPPAPGHGFYYLARGNNCAEQTGTYDTTGTGQVEPRDPQLQGDTQCGCSPGDDFDADGQCNAFDNCLFIPNADQTDSDSDGLGNVCDNCPLNANPGQYDGDSDGVGEPCDNCRWVYNPTQFDGNDNGVGEVCECFSLEDCDDGLPCTNDACIFDITDPTGQPGQCRHNPPIC